MDAFLTVWFPRWSRPNWMITSFPVLRIIIMVLLLVVAFVLVICILFQAAKSSGLGALSGQGTETYYSKNKGRSLEGLLKRLTVILSVSALVLTVMYLVSIQLVTIDYVGGGGGGTDNGIIEGLNFVRQLAFSFRG